MFRAASYAGRCRTTSSRSTSRAGTTSSRRARRCGSRPICSPTAPSGSRTSTRSRSLATTSGKPARPRCRSRVHSRERHRVLPGGGGRGALARRVRRASLVLLQLAQRLLPGGREVPGGTKALGADHAGALRCDEPARVALRFHAQTGGSTLTAQQPENNVVRVAIQALAAVSRRSPVAAHEQLRRGPRAAHRARRPDRAPNAADPPERGGDDRDDGSTWWALLRRGAHERARASRPRS